MPAAKIDTQVYAVLRLQEPGFDEPFLAQSDLCC